MHTVICMEYQHRGTTYLHLANWFDPRLDLRIRYKPVYDFATLAVANGERTIKQIMIPMFLPRTSYHSCYIQVAIAVEGLGLIVHVHLAGDRNQWLDGGSTFIHIYLVILWIMKVEICVKCRMGFL